MNLSKLLYMLFLAMLLLSCEEAIDIQLDDAAPRIVIEGNLSNLSDVQTVRVSRTILL